MRLEWHGGEQHPRDYGRVTSAIGRRYTPPDGRIIHTAGATPDGGLRVFDVWESRDHIEPFCAERLMPMMGEVLSGARLMPGDHRW